MYALSSLIAGTFSWSGLANAALDAFLVSSAIAFITSGISYVKHLCRSKPVSTAELAREVNNVENIPVKELNHTNGIDSKGEFKKFVEEIRVDGIKEPIKYVEINNGKYIVDGNHRVFAAKLLKMQTVPAQKVSLPYNGFSTIDDVIWDNVMYLSLRG